MNTLRPIQTVLPDCNAWKLTPCQSTKQGSCFVFVIYFYAAHSFPVAITLASVISSPVNQTLGTSTPSLSQIALMCLYLLLQILDDSQRRELLLLSSALLATCLSPAPVSAACLWPIGTSAVDCNATSLQVSFSLN